MDLMLLLVQEEAMTIYSLHSYACILARRGEESSLDSNARLPTGILS